MIFFFFLTNPTFAQDFMYFESYLLSARVQPFYYYNFAIRHIAIITKASKKKHIKHKFKVA